MDKNSKVSKVSKVSKDDSVLSGRHAVLASLYHRDLGSLPAGNDGSDVDVDQFPLQDFNINEFGYPYNDVSLLMRAQTKEEFDMLSSRLQEIPSYDVDDGLTDEEKLSNLNSRYDQDVTEYSRSESLKSVKYDLDNTLFDDKNENVGKSRDSDNDGSGVVNGSVDVTA